MNKRLFRKAPFEATDEMLVAGAAELDKIECSIGPMDHEQLRAAARRLWRVMLDAAPEPEKASGGLKGGPLRLMKYLQTIADKNGWIGDDRPSSTMIALAAGVDRGGLHRMFDSLEARGYLKRKQVRNIHAHRTPIYHFKIIKRV